MSVEVCWNLDAEDDRLIFLTMNWSKPRNLELKIVYRRESHWSEMEGNDQVRFCSLCQKNVYNVCNMSKAQVKELILRKRRGERICVRQTPGWLTMGFWFTVTVIVAFITFGKIQMKSAGKGILLGQSITQRRP